MELLLIFLFLPSYAESYEMAQLTGLVNSSISIPINITEGNPETINIKWRGLGKPNFQLVGTCKDNRCNGRNSRFKDRIRIINTFIELSSLGTEDGGILKISCTFAEITEKYELQYNLTVLVPLPPLHIVCTLHWINSEWWNVTLQAPNATTKTMALSWKKWNETIGYVPLQSGSSAQLSLPRERWGERFLLEAQNLNLKENISFTIEDTCQLKDDGDINTNLRISLVAIPILSFFMVLLLLVVLTVKVKARNFLSKIPFCGWCEMGTPEALEDQNGASSQYEAQLWMGPLHEADQLPLERETVGGVVSETQALVYQEIEGTLRVSVAETPALGRTPTTPHSEATVEFEAATLPAAISSEGDSLFIVAPMIELLPPDLVVELGTSDAPVSPANAIPLLEQPREAHMMVAVPVPLEGNVRVQRAIVAPACQSAARVRGKW